MIASSSSSTDDSPATATTRNDRAQREHLSVDIDNQTASHYTSHDASSYESAYFYEPGPYIEYLKELVRNQYFQLEEINDQQPKHSLSMPRKVLLDIGGGTGNFTKLLVHGTRVKAIVMDPFLEHTREHTISVENDSSSDNQLIFVKEAAEAFIPSPSTRTAVQQIPFWKQNYDYILLKEVAHHIQETDRILIFRGLYNGLNPKTQHTNKTENPEAPSENKLPPSLLIVTRPQHEIDYPLWDAARTVWAMNQPPAEQFMEELRQAGFSNVRYRIESYPCSVPLQRWQAMIRGRFWSTFTYFSDDDLEAACQTIASNEKHRVDSHGNLHFEDRLVFITGTKTLQDNINH